MDAKIEMIKEDYAIVMVPSMSNCLCFVTVNTPNSNESSFLKFKEGQNISIVVTHVPADLSLDAFNTQKIVAVPRSMKNDSVKQKAGFDTRKKLNTPIDSSLEYLDQLTPGTRVNVRVKSVKSNQLNVEIASNLCGRIHVTELCDSGDDLEDVANPFHSYKSGDIIEAKVVGFHDIKTNTYLPISKPTGSNSVVVDFTLKKSDLSLANGVLSSIGDSRYKNIATVEIGQEFNGFVQRTTPDAVWVYLAPNLLARAFVLECSDSSTIMKDLPSNFQVGQFVACRVIGKDDARNSIDLTFRLAEDSQVKPGNIVPARVSNSTPEGGLVVQVSGQRYGRVHLMDIADVLTKNPTSAYKRGDFIDCYILDQDVANNRIDLSLRDSRLSGMEIDDGAVEIKDISDISFDMLVKGYVKNVSDSGCFISLNRKLVARVKISDLSDGFVRDWKKDFARGKLVSGRIIGYVCFYVNV
jgi:rRNA biogenesis protein RRP5